jgi:hypothetical protein
VDVPYPAKAHQRCPRARSRALVAHPRENPRPVDKVGVRRERYRRKGLARLSGLICKLVLVDDLSYDIALTLCRRVAEVEVGRSARRSSRPAQPDSTLVSCS